MNIFTILFSFRGRHNRARFWLISLVGLLWFCVAGFLSYASASRHDALF
jgi:uncharacterized membrane protein YhaH (DUF805 family)